MNREQNPERLRALLLAIRLHPTLADATRDSTGEKPNGDAC